MSPGFSNQTQSWLSLQPPNTARTARAGVPQGAFFAALVESVHGKGARHAAAAPEARRDQPAGDVSRRSLGWFDDTAENGFERRVFGITDGDGEDFATLADQFDEPFAGPLFAWKGYSIESLFPQLPWPSAWGAAPNWQTDLLCYAPYIAINRLRNDLTNRLEKLRLNRFLNPNQGQPLETIAAMSAVLQKSRELLTEFDAAKEFERVGLLQRPSTSAIA